MNGDQVNPSQPPPTAAELIVAAFAVRPQPIRVHTYLQRWGTFSAPVALIGDDGQVYVVKGRQAGRQDVYRAMVNDHVVARLGAQLGAPVPEVAIVDVPNELVAGQAEMRHMQPGLAHGSRRLDGVSERAAINHVRIDGNRPRFTRLAVLYGWIHAGDHRFVYKKTEPQLVYSVDHGHFFPNGPIWSIGSLAQAPAAQVDATITQACGLTRQEIEDAVRRLANISNQTIAEVVAGPPDEWGLSLDERVALFSYLLRRRDELVAAYDPR